MTVYAIMNYDIVDPEGYARYSDKARLIDINYEILVGDHETTTLEGEPAGKTTYVMAFESEQAFDDWYRSPAYQEALPHRLGASNVTLGILVKGRA
jgi:uncharacterized protein (DUF1330 family)